MSSAKNLVIALLFGVLGAAGMTAFSLYHFATRSGAPATVIIDIRPGSSLARIAGRLEEEQALSSARKFMLLNRLLGSGKQLRAGEYEIAAGTSPLTIIEMLSQGRVRQHFFTIPEGFSRRQIGARLAGLELCPPQEFEQLTTDPVFLRKFGISAASAEGYLFPETYSYTRPANAAALIAAMLRTG
ncbi:MAG: endolytic transglycosylase MltG, partial [Deltaproteobacteria bacterium]|nr:endolytic transglycosylase MltG [Deltaproteobacteria bacterium]